MKNYLLLVSAIAIAALFISSRPSPANTQYEYMTIHAPVSVSKPEVFISKAGQPMNVVEYKKDDFDMSTELARIENFEKEGWELFSVVNQNSVDMNILFIMRRPK